jgi:hypothetical protein
VLLSARGAALAEAAVWLGHATNNEAEYTGLVAGLHLARRCGVRRLLVEGGAWRPHRAAAPPLICGAAARAAAGVTPLRARARAQTRRW